MATRTPPPIGPQDPRFMDWLQLLWRRALSPSGVAAGTYGGTLSFPIVGLNTYGQVATATSVGMAATAPITLAYGTGTATWGHGTSGVTSGTYGGTLAFPIVGVNTTGHVTSGTSVGMAVEAPITLAYGAGTATWGHSTSGVASGTYGGTSAIPVLGVNTSGHVISGTSVTPSQVLDSIGFTTGAILYRGTGAWAALAAGTAGQVLTMGTSGLPEWV